jgi:pilus assembly protein Flp/PilA
MFRERSPKTRNGPAMKMRLERLGEIVASEEGVTAIEYSLLGALIVVVIVGAVGLVGTKTSALWSLVQNCVSFATDGGGSCP